MQRAVRLANGPQPLAARVRHAAHHTPATGCALLSADGTALQTLQQVATICGLLQQTALRCNRLQQAGPMQRIALCCTHRCNRLQRAVVCCNGLWSVAADRTELQSSLQQVATGCGLLQPDCTVLPSSLQPVATGCGLLQQAVVCCQRIALCCNHRCNRLQRAVVYCNRLWSIVSGSHCVAIIAATGCNGLKSVANCCALLQRTAHRCNRSSCAATSQAAVLRHARPVL